MQESHPYFWTRSAKVMSSTLKYKKKKKLIRLGIDAITASTWRLDTGESVIAVTKLYLEHWSWLWQTASEEWRWHQTLRMGDSCFTWTNLPLAPSVFLMSSMPTSPIQVQRETCILVLPSLLASPLFPLIILTLLVMWEIWVAGMFFHQARHRSLCPQLFPKCMVRATKK